MERLPSRCLEAQFGTVRRRRPGTEEPLWIPSGVYTGTGVCV